MSTLDFEMQELGATNDAYDSDASSTWTGTESARRPFLLLHKRTRKEKIFRKGPAPLDDLTLIGQRLTSSKPGLIDDDITNDASPGYNEVNEDEFAGKREISRAGSRGLLTYFAKLANSSDNEQIDAEFVNSLLRGGADINVTDRYGQCIIHEVVRQWHVDVAQFCMEKGADIDKPDSFGRTPLHLAATVNYPDMIEWLVRNGADIHRKTKGEAQTAIHYAVKYNAIEALQVLLENGANILDRDYKERTPLFLAAESGRPEACRFLLQYGAPAGVFDDCGTSAVSHMVEKMPDVAREALSQFQEVDKASRQKYFYLNYLEIPFWQALGRKAGRALRQTCARSSLQLIVLCDELNLIMHPVILQLVRWKWNSFGKWNAISYLIINIFYTLIWTAIGLTVPRDHDIPYYTPLTKNAYRVVIEVIGCAMTIFFLIQQLIQYRRMQSREKIYEQWRIREIERDLQHCHPRWPEEQRFLVSEVNRVKSSKSSFFVEPWVIFEWLTFFGVFVMMGTRVATVLLNDVPSEKLHNRSIAIALILIWLRLMKYCRAFRSLGPFITMLGHIIIATFKFAFLFFEFFIPYCCAFWILFGEKKGTEFMEVNDMIYQVYLMTLVADFKFDQLSGQDKIMAQLLVGSYLAIASVVCLNLYIALMSDTFARVGAEATANAYMSQAAQLMAAEQALSEEKSTKMTENLLTDCSPQVVNESSTEDSFSEKDMLSDLTLKVDHLTNLINANLENSSAVRKEMDILRNKVHEIENFQRSTTNEILKLTKENSKWQIRNLIKSVPTSFSERVKRSFVKDKDDEAVYYEEEEDDDDGGSKQKGQLWKWLKK